MPSLPCHHCGKVKRCAMHRDDERGGAVVYLCAKCERELGYAEKKGATA